jgi:hypothetical protein
MKKWIGILKIVHCQFMEKISLKESFCQKYLTKTQFSLYQRTIFMKRIFRKQALKTYNKKASKDK